MKRLVALILAAILLVGALPFAGAAFKDAESIDKKYKAAVTAMSDQKIIGGFEDGTFGPEKTLTRAQAAKILCVMLEGEEKANALTKTETGFADVPASHWAAKYIAYCVDKGIVAGVGEGKFDPNGTLSSGAFAKMLLVAYGEDGAKFTGADWLKNVQTAAAEPNFLLFNLKEVSTAGASRQEACQMAFNAKFWSEAKAAKANAVEKPMYTGVPRSLKLLVVGNSFGNDCSLNYLYQLLQEAGVKEIVIGTLYYSGCSFQQHTTFGLTDQAVYKYYKNTTGKAKQIGKKQTSAYALKDEKWDVLIVSTGFKRGYPESYHPWQDAELYYLQQACPDAIFGFNSTWACRSDSTHKSYISLYNQDQKKQYDMGNAAVQSEVLTEKRYSFVLPTGTAVQNARTSFLGDHLDRDGYHMNKGIGRYTVAMVLCCKLTGVDPDTLTYLPDAIVQDKKDYTIPGQNMKAPGLKEALGKVARESVKNAIAKPFEVTQSQNTVAP